MGGAASACASSTSARLPERRWRLPTTARMRTASSYEPGPEESQAGSFPRALLQRHGRQSTRAELGFGAQAERRAHAAAVVARHDDQLEAVAAGQQQRLPPRRRAGVDV